VKLSTGLRRQLNPVEMMTSLSMQPNDHDYGNISYKDFHTESVVWQLIPCGCSEAEKAKATYNSNPSEPLMNYITEPVDSTGSGVCCYNSLFLPSNGDKYCQYSLCLTKEDGQAELACRIYELS